MKGAFIVAGKVKRNVSWEDVIEEFEENFSRHPIWKSEPRIMFSQNLQMSSLRDINSRNYIWAVLNYVFADGWSTKCFKPYFQPRLFSRFSPLQLSDMPRSGFESTQKPCLSWMKLCSSDNPHTTVFALMISKNYDLLIILKCI